MQQIVVTHVNGTTLKLQSKENNSTIVKAVQTVEMLGQDLVNITVQSAVKLDFFIGDKVTIIGRDYTLNSPARERKDGSRSFEYELQFEGVQYDLLRANFSVNVNTTTNAVQDLNGDSLTGDLKMFLDVLVANANRVFPSKWSIGTYPNDTKTTTQTFSETDNCLAVLQSLCSEANYGVEFHIGIDGSGNRTINVGVVGQLFPFTLEYGKGKGIYELNREKQSASNIITRLNVFGSSKNIMTTKYRASRLCLPTKAKGASYLEDATAIAKYGVWESTKIFEDIYPHRTGTITAIDGLTAFADNTMNFDLNAKDGNGNTLYLIPGVSAKIHITSGNLAGYEFEIAKYDNSTKVFTIVQQTDENGYQFPSSASTAFQFAIGNKYVLSDIYMPQSYITAAEAELQTAGQAWLNKYKQPNVRYGLTVDRFYLANAVGLEADSNVLWAGDYLPVKDADLGVDTTLRVKSFTRDLLDDLNYTSITIADLPVTVTTITNVISDIKGLSNIVRINNLVDPARARRNYLSAQEVLNMVFDPEGDFYTEKIKPLSIDTTMLSVGAKSMQFGLVGTVFQPNYNAAKNRVVYTGGTLTHYSVLDESSNPRTWTLSDGDITLPTDAAYYIYAKCIKVGTGGTMLFSTSKITSESDPNYYHFFIGVINAVIDNVRALALMYGFTTVNGRFIKTGRITSTDGQTYFDLDAGEFKGAFKFTNGTSVDTAISTAQNNAISTAAADATAKANAAYANSQSFANAIKADLQSQIDGNITSWFFDYEPTLANVPASNWTQPAVSDIHLGDLFYWTSKGWSYRFQKVGSVYSWTRIADTDVTKALADAATAQTIANSKMQTFSVQPTPPYAIGDLWLGGATGDLKKCKTAKATGGAFSSADWELASKYTDDTAVNNLQIGGRNLVLNSTYNSEALRSPSSSFIQKVMNISPTIKSKVVSVVTQMAITVWFDEYSSGFGTTKPFTSIVVGMASGSGDAWSERLHASDGTIIKEGAYWVWRGVKSFPVGSTIAYTQMIFLIFEDTTQTTGMKLVNVKAELGNKSTDWTPAPEDVQAEIDNAATAASNAQSAANTANNLLADIASDNKLVPSEKSAALNEQMIIVNEYSKNTAQADLFAIDKTAYVAAYNALDSYLNPLLANMTTTSDIVGSTFMLKWREYYDARTDLLNAIAIKAKDIAISTAAADATNKVNAVQIGGRNLLRNSLVVKNNQLSIGIINNGGTSLTVDNTNLYNAMPTLRVSGGGGFFFGHNPEIKSGVDYTASMMIKSDSAYSGTYYTPLHIQLPVGAHNYENIGAFSTDVDNTWRQIWVTFKATNNTNIRIYLYGYSAPCNIAWVKLEQGNKATDWTPAPEDIPSALDYLAQAIQGSTDIDGGLLATNVLTMKDSNAQITGGMSGLSSDNVGMWTGGTYQDALANLAKIIMRKDGSGQLAGGKILWDLAGALKVGNFNIEGGAIVGYGDNKDKIKLHTGDIPSLSTLSSGQLITGGDTYSITVSNYRYHNDNDTIIQDTVTFNDSGTLVLLPNTNISLYLPTASHTLTNLTFISATKVYKIYQNNVLLGTYSSNGSVLLVNGGTYVIKYEYTIVFRISPYAIGSIGISTSSEGYITYQLTPERSEIGKNGLYSYWNSALYFYFSAIEGLKYRGLIDMPTGLGGATVTSGGSVSRNWGVIASGTQVTKSGANITINHTIGDDKYTAELIGVGVNVTGYISSRSTTQIVMVVSGTFTSGSVDIVLKRTI